jgi:hypothetical protein
VSAAGCDGALTRVLVTHQPTTRHGDPCRHHDHHGHGDPGRHHDPGDPAGGRGLAARLQTAMTPAQRLALAVRDGGGVVPGCDRPWPGGRRIIWGTGWMAARPIWPTWCCCAGPIIGRSMTAAGS